MRRIEKVQNDIIRWVTGHTRKERISTDKLRKEVKMVTVEDNLCWKRLEWLGRLTRMGGNRLVGRVWGAKCEGKRGRGRPRWMYEKQEAEDLARDGVHRLQALDGKEWKRVVRKIKEPQWQSMYGEGLAKKHSCNFAKTHHILKKFSDITNKRFSKVCRKNWLFTSFLAKVIDIFRVFSNQPK